MKNGKFQLVHLHTCVLAAMQWCLLPQGSFVQWRTSDDAEFFARLLSVCPFVWLSDHPSIHAPDCMWLTGWVHMLSKWT